ncbi:hypothetical protein RFI_29754, partial [Reticulomyxa filosa]
MIIVAENTNKKRFDEVWYLLPFLITRIFLLFEICVRLKHKRRNFIGLSRDTIFEQVLPKQLKIPCEEVYNETAVEQALVAKQILTPFKQEHFIVVMHPLINLFSISKFPKFIKDFKEIDKKWVRVYFDTHMLHCQVIPSLSPVKSVNENTDYHTVLSFHSIKKKSSFSFNSFKVKSTNNIFTIPKYELNQYMNRNTTNIIIIFSLFAIKNSSGNSNVICSGSRDNTIRFWDIRSNKNQLYVIKGEDSGIICIKLSQFKKMRSGEYSTNHTIF